MKFSENKMLKQSQWASVTEALIAHAYVTQAFGGLQRSSWQLFKITFSDMKDINIHF